MSPCEDRRSWAATSIEQTGLRIQIGASSTLAGAPAVGFEMFAPATESEAEAAVTAIVYVIALAVLALLALLVAAGVIAIVIAVHRSRRRKALPQQPPAGHGATPPSGLRLASAASGWHERVAAALTARLLTLQQHDEIVTDSTEEHAGPEHVRCGIRCGAIVEPVG